MIGLLLSPAAESAGAAIITPIGGVAMSRRTTKILFLFAAALAPQALPAASVSGAQCVPAGQNCTANDATPTVLDILEINGQPDVPGAGCTDGDLLDQQLRIDYTGGASGGSPR